MKKQEIKTSELSENKIYFWREDGDDLGLWTFCPKCANKSGLKLTIVELADTDSECNGCDRSNEDNS